MADPAATTTRVVLCDDAAGFPELVTSWLAAADGLVLTARTATLTALLELLPEEAPDVVLLDFMLPEGPTDAARITHLREVTPGVRIVLVSSLPPVALREEALKTGADAWCSKATTAPRLLDAIRG